MVNPLHSFKLLKQKSNILDVALFVFISIFLILLEVGRDIYQMIRSYETTLKFGMYRLNYPH